jgi:hypothetical protein
MSSKRIPISYKGRSIGILVFTVAQLFIGVIHVFFGALLLAFGSSILQATEAYDVYTLVFGLSVMIFAVFIWQGKKEGWIGTIAVSLFITAADTLKVSNLPSIPGIPSFAPPIEIGYSIIVIIYLSLPHVRRKFFA